MTAAGLSGGTSKAVLVSLGERDGGVLAWPWEFAFFPVGQRTLSSGETALGPKSWKGYLLRLGALLGRS